MDEEGRVIFIMRRAEEEEKKDQEVNEVKVRGIS